MNEKSFAVHFLTTAAIIAVMVVAFGVLVLRVKPTKSEIDSSTPKLTNRIDPNLLDQPLFNDIQAKDTNGLPVPTESDDKPLDNPFEQK